MAIDDVKVYDAPAFGTPGDMEFAVAASATTIKAGEPVLKLLGASGTVVAPLTTNFPTSVAAQLLGGIATSTSTNTATAAGTVKVMKLVPGMTYTCAPLTAATWNTQAKYEALVGARVLFDLTSSTYTITASDNAAYGLTVEPLNIANNPGKVRFSVRLPATYLGWGTGIS